jgi:hypothetical protein
LLKGMGLNSVERSKVAVPKGDSQTEENPFEEIAREANKPN